MAPRGLNRTESAVTEEINVRVEDYLNDKLQTHADLENLDTLLDSVKQQQELLRRQLADTEKELSQVEETYQAQQADLVDRTKKFKKKQDEIDRRLLIITQSETSDEASQKFSESMQKLHRLDIAAGYVGLLSKVDQLSSEARKNFRASPQAALKPYVELRNLTNALKKAQPAADYAAPHLIDYVDQTTSTIWSQMKEAFGSDFNKTLDKIRWPSKDLVVDDVLLEEWSEGVSRLLELQAPELQAYEAEQSNLGRQQNDIVLLPLEVMVAPLQTMFRLRFQGESQLSRLDKPELFFQNALKYLNTYDEFFSVYLQPILHQHFRGTNLALNPLFIDSTSALIAAILPMVRQKISSFLPQVAKQPALLSHFMRQLIQFDSELRDDWAYDGGQGSEGWRGLSWEVLEQQGWFERWLQVEKDFALARYNEIITPADSGEIDYESVDPGITKPTKAAIRVNDLLETITERYQRLSSFSQKLRFLMDIQISIFDAFHSRLRDSLEAYLHMTSALTRTMQSISKEDQASLQGTGGLDRLCRVYGSADYLERKMSDWSDDLFFLELWEELQFRARANEKSGRAVAKNVSLEDLAQRTSSNVGSASADTDSSGALFDETSGAYRRLRIRAEETMLEAVARDLRDALRPYARINSWSSVVDADADAAPVAESVSAELDGAVRLLGSYLGFLTRAIAEAPLRRIARHLATALQAFFWDSVLARNSFSIAGVAQLRTDVALLWDVFDRHVAPGLARNAMRRLHEAIELLSIPAATESGAGGEEGAAPRGRSIQEIEQEIYKDNESAREMLEELGFEALSESDARKILEKRVDLAY